jgi:hypothetical protein
MSVAVIAGDEGDSMRVCFVVVFHAVASVQSKPPTIPMPRPIVIASLNVPPQT